MAHLPASESGQWLLPDVPQGCLAHERGSVRAVKPEGKYHRFGLGPHGSSASGLPLTRNEDAEGTFIVVLALIL